LAGQQILEQICRDISSIDLKPTLHRRLKYQERETFDFAEIEECNEWEQMVEEQDLVNLAIQYVETTDLAVEDVLMVDLIEVGSRRCVNRVDEALLLLTLLVELAPPWQGSLGFLL
jgi:hypothetical protein